MIRFMTASLIGALLTVWTSLVATADEVVAYKGGTILTGTGATLSGGVLLVKNGKILAVGTEVSIPPGVRVVDVSDRVVMPGLVNPLTYLAQSGRDDEESVSPDVRAADGIDLFARNRDLLRGGVTTYYVAPGRARLLSGTGAMARAAGKPETRILRTLAGLRVNLGERSKNPPPLFSPPVPPSSRRPFQPSKPQLPGSRPGAMLEIRRTFEAARAYLAARDRSRAGKGRMPRRNLEFEAMEPVLKGEIPLRVNVHTAADILRALTLGGELKVKVVLEGATEAYRVATALAEARVSVVVNSHVFPGQTYPHDDTREVSEGLRDLRNAGILARAGVEVVLCLPASMNAGDLMLGAGWAVRYGMPVDRALRAVTLGAAEVCGVADRVGSLEKGKEADFLILDRDPFDVRAEPLEVYLSGKRVYRRSTEKPVAEILAVQAGRILTQAGQILHNATVLIENGKIVDLGPSVIPPSTARVVKIPGGVVTPGFIDTLSHVGLHQDTLTPSRSGQPPRQGMPRIPGRPSPQRRVGGLGLKDNISDVIQPGDDGYAALLRAGVTTVILAPGGKSEAQMAAVKIGARSREDLVLRKVAGVRYPMRLLDSASRKSAATRLESALKRVKAYIGKFAKYEKDLKAYEEARAAPETASDSDKEKKAPDKGKKSAKKKKPEAPKKPSVDEGMEAWKAALEGRAAVVVSLGREDTIERALEVFRKYDLKPVLLQADEAHRVVDAVNKGAAGVLAGPPFVRREPDGTPVFNARILSDAGVAVAFYTGGGSGSKFLPLHALFAVRNGMTKAAALKGLTVVPARLFHIDDRVGTLEIGKDGDLVVFSGDPFDLSSRIEVVVAGGRVVHDARGANGSADSLKK